MLFQLEDDPGRPGLEVWVIEEKVHEYLYERFQIEVIGPEEVFEFEKDNWKEQLNFFFYICIL